MAAFRKRKNRWDVQIRRSGYLAICKTFFHKTDAQKWAMEIERQIEVGDYVAADLLNLDTLGALLAHYSAEISIKKRGRVEEISRSAKMRRHKISALPLGKLKPFHIAQYRDERLQEVSTTTAKKELQLISHALDIGRREWGLNIKNVAAGVAKPKEPKGRERRLEENEEHLLLDVLSASENHWIKPLMEFAIETGMRRRELLKLRWEDVNLGSKTALIKETKNGGSRTIPLSVAVIGTLSGLPHYLGGNVFPVTPNALRGVWRRAAKKVRIDNLRFHDLRHEATSRLFEKGLNVMEVATITGHKDLKMLQRYTHLRAEDLAKKLG
jgi:integrase